MHNEDLMTSYVGCETEAQLVSLVAQYKKLRTYPHATDKHQQELHRRMVRLAESGRVQLVRDAGSTWEWTA